MNLGIIQARIDSQRFPAKIFAKFSDGTVVLERVISQVLYAKSVDKVVVATNNISFNAIRRFVKEKFLDKVTVIPGSDEDVLSRFIKCVKFFGIENIRNVIRITADNPLTCPVFIDKAVEIHTTIQSDLTHFLGIPLGTGVEVINPNSLLEISFLASSKYDREHVTPFFYKNRHIYRVCEPMYDIFSNYQVIRVTIDTLEDLNNVEHILRTLDYKIPITVNDILKVATPLNVA